MKVKFLENKPNVAQTGPAWYFDLDYLTDSMDYSRVRPTNPFAVVEGTQAEKEELASLERQEHEANAEVERLGLEFAQAEEDLVFSAAKSFQTPSTNAVTSGSTPVTPGSTPVTPGTPLTPGTPVTPDSAPFATSTSPD
ncbi:hypothetical protein Tco_0325447, partial [Tanacetum coccineum]